MNLTQFLLRESWKHIAIATLTGSISGICSAALLAFINSALTHQDTSIDILFSGFLGLAIVTLFSSLISRFLLVNLAQDAVYRLRLRLSRWILASPLRHLEEIGASRLLATLTDDVQAISFAVYDLPFLCIDVAVIIGCLIYLSWLSWFVFAFTILFLVITIGSVQLLIVRGKYYMKFARDEQDRLFQHFRTITAGIKELKLHSDRQEAFFHEELTYTAKSVRNYRVTSFKILAIAVSFGEILFFILLGSLIFGLPKLIPVSTPILSGYILTITFLMRPLQSLFQILPEMNQATVALQKIDTLGLSLVERSETTPFTQPFPPQFQRIRLQGITYIYHNQREEQSFTLGPIDLEFQPGELIFIVGGNGSGKSTLAKLLTGLYVPEFGEIYVDQKLITNQNRQAYRQLFAAVFSDFFLFERILGIYLDDLDIQAQTYLKQLQLEHKVQIKEGVLSTIDLSQGQRKRLALLTAYLENRPIYVFDEWASDQDPFFRDIFYHQLLPDMKHQGKVVFVISHDDRYFHLADRLIKLDYGKLTEAQH
ncbi:cyclic peptide export ABC transporter [Scytonema sp. NUACC26]|uniref:cyclic peptide export ABC transporter n=1 Tax=Scytonema sp. NUACC26 TaxID=3140176 RepID=UPI0034DC108F